MIDYLAYPGRKTPRGLMGALVRCACGHGIGAHSRAGCGVGVYAPCSCPLTDAEALDHAIALAGRPLRRRKLR